MISNGQSLAQSKRNMDYPDRKTHQHSHSRRQRGKARGNRWKKRENESDDSADDSADESGLSVRSEREREKFKDLLVFGYASRIFHDDDKARLMDQGKHLIPWMGDPGNLIDRYDCRGHLHNLQEYDASTAASWCAPQPNDEEAKLEAMCEAERYRDLVRMENERRKRVQEERQKEMENEYLKAIAPPPLIKPEVRDAQSSSYPTGSAKSFPSSDSKQTSASVYGTVGFSYSYSTVPPPPPPESSNAATEPLESDLLADLEKDEYPHVSKLIDAGPESPFIPREDFDIPAHICLPQHKRLNSIIERTAVFVAEKGSQLEVVIRAKQAANESFSFLQPKDMLFPYYRFLVDAIKKGIYKPAPESPPSTSESDDSDSEDGHYLHPSLFKSQSKPLTSTAAITQQTPVADVFQEPNTFSTLYGTLINKVRSVNQSTTQTSSTQLEGGRPSPDVVSAIEKMAIYVVKNGLQFEAMIKERHGPDDPKFGFVHGYHPYHSLYDDFKRQARTAKDKPIEIISVDEILAETAALSNEEEDEKDHHSVVAAKPVSPQLPPPITVPPPPPPPPPEPVQEDPRIAELKRKALEASLRVAEKLKERQNSAKAAALPPPIIFSVKSIVKEKLAERSSEERESVLDALVDRKQQRDREKTMSSKPKLVTAETRADPGSLLELMRLEQLKHEASDKIRSRKTRKEDSDEDQGPRKKKKKRSRNSSSDEERTRSRKVKRKEKSRSPDHRSRKRHHRRSRSRS